jgi:hypothetical protein
MVRFGVVLPFGRLKFIDAKSLAARFADAGAGKVLPRFVERRASWERVKRLVERPRIAFEKLPARTLRAAKLRLFRSFKLLGALKRQPAIFFVEHAN